MDGYRFSLLQHSPSAHGTRCHYWGRVRSRRSPSFRHCRIPELVRQSWGNRGFSTYLRCQLLQCCGAGSRIPEATAGQDPRCLSRLNWSQTVRGSSSCRLLLAGMLDVRTGIAPRGFNIFRDCSSGSPSAAESADPLYVFRRRLRRVGAAPFEGLSDSFVPVLKYTEGSTPQSQTRSPQTPK